MNNLPTAVCFQITHNNNPYKKTELFYFTHKWNLNRYDNSSSDWIWK